MRVTSLRCKSVPKDVTQCIIGGQQILNRASDKRLLLLVSKCNLVLVSASLRHPLKIRMRLSVELVWNNLSKLGKRGRTDRSARHPAHSTSIVIIEVDSGIELHDKILIVLVRELTERYETKPPKSIIHTGINMSIIPQVLHIDLLVGTKLLLLSHHQLIENSGLKRLRNLGSAPSEVAA